MMHSSEETYTESDEDYVPDQSGDELSDLEEDLDYSDADQQSDAGSETIYTFSENDLSFQGYDHALQDLKIQNPAVFDKIEQIRERLVQELPNIEKILEQPISIEDQTKLFEMCEIFFRTPPLTLEWLDLKKNIHKMLEQSIQKYKEREALSEEERCNLERELDVLNNFYVSELSLESKIALMKIPIEHKGKIYTRYKAWCEMETTSDEYNKLGDWLQTVTKIPFSTYATFENTNIIKNLKNQLDETFYGMDRVKEQILIYVNNRINGIHDGNLALALKGPPGVGKTHIASMLSKILSYPFYQLSGSSLNTTDSICGHSYTYIGSQPGGIVKSLIQLKHNNGIIFIDEFEKIPMDKTLNTMLQIFDPVQNNQFKDHYVGDIPIDLSKIWFIVSMNDLPENSALTDRLFIVDIPEYTSKEKYDILDKYSIPKLKKELDLDIIFPSECISYLIEYHKDATGVRTLIHSVKNVFHKVKFILQNPDVTTSFSIDSKSLSSLSVQNLQKLLPSKNTPNFMSMYT